MLRCPVTWQPDRHWPRQPPRCRPWPGGHEQAAQVPGRGPGWTPPEAGHVRAAGGGRGLVDTRPDQPQPRPGRHHAHLHPQPFAWPAGLTCPRPTPPPTLRPAARSSPVAGRPDRNDGSRPARAALTQPDPPSLFVTSPSAEQAFTRCQDRASLLISRHLRRRPRRSRHHPSTPSAGDGSLRTSASPSATSGAARSPATSQRWPRMRCGSSTSARHSAKKPEWTRSSPPRKAAGDQACDHGSSAIGRDSPVWRPGT